MQDSLPYKMEGAYQGFRLDYAGNSNQRLYEAVGEDYAKVELPISD